jgi:uncharacterized protein (TIGR02145 family)
MRKKTNFSIYLLLLMGVFLVFASSCEKDDNNNTASGNATNGMTTAVFNSNVTYGTMTDQDGNVYKTLTIGTQTWMAENLRTTIYNDGTAIHNVTDNDEWLGLTIGAYCNYNNTTSVDTIATYGRLYNWYAVNTGKLAPTGWHVPTDAEWTQLADYLGGTSVAGGKLKETDTSHWNSPNTSATNETGFTALPGGGRGGGRPFGDIGGRGFWWSATEYDTAEAWARGIYYEYSKVIRYYNYKEFGFSVRFVRDN